MDHINAFFEKYLEGIFWFIVLLSWVPLITGVSIIPGNNANIDIFEAGVKVSEQLVSGMVLPEPRYFGSEYFTILTILFALSIPVIVYLRRQKIFELSKNLLAVKNVGRTRKFSELEDHERADIKRSLPMYLLALSPLVTSLVIGRFANGAPADNFLFGACYLIYVASVIVSFYVYMRSAHLISTPFVIFVFVLFFDAIALYLSHWIQLGSDTSQISSHYSIFGVAYSAYAIDLLKVLIFLSGIALLRLIYLFVSDNRYFVKNADRSSLVGDIKRSALLWSPLLAMFLFFTFLYSSTYSNVLQPSLVSQILDCSGMESIPPEENGGYIAPADCASMLENEDGSSISVEEALQIANTQRLGLLTDETNRVINQINYTAQGEVDSAADKVHRDIKASVPRRLPGTRTRSCGLNIICLVENGLKSAVNSAYVSVKNRQLAKLRIKLNEIEKTTKENGDDFAGAAKDEVLTQFSLLEHVNKSAIEGTATSLKAFSIIMLLYSIFVLIKTFGIVFSRVWFDVGATNNITFRNKSDLAVYGQPTAVGKGQPFKQKKSDGILYCSQSNCMMDGVSDDKIVPQPWTGFFTRLLHSQRSMLRLDPNLAKPRKPITLTVDDPNRLVSWKLAEGERVVFSFKDLVAMSENVRIERRVSLSVYTLVFGKLIQYCAYSPHGDSLLILRTLGDPEVVDKEHTRAVAPLYLSNMIAWNVFTNFKVSSTLDVYNTLWSAERVGPEANRTDLVVMDKSPKRQKGLGRGLIRFVKTFVLPV